MSSANTETVTKKPAHRRTWSMELPPGCSTESQDDPRIVLLGKTGVGKSSTVNTILGRDAFKVKQSFESVTKESQRETSEINGRRITVIDTPGLEIHNEEIQREITNCISMILPGPHVFLLLIPLGRFTKEEEKSVKIIQEMFGKNSLMYTMVLFTRGDFLKKKSIEEFLGNPEIRKLTEECGNRYHVFNNIQTGNRTQVSDLLEKIDNMVKANGGSFYSWKMFRQMEREKQEQQMKILMEKVEQMNREIEELMKKHEEEKEKMKMMEEERQNQEKERKRTAKEFNEREEQYKSKIKEQEKKEREIHEVMRRERQEWEKQKLEEKTRIEDQTKKHEEEKERIRMRMEEERQNQEKERKRRENEFNEREDKYKSKIKEKVEKEIEILKAMRRERQEWEKQKLEEKTRREEEDDKRQREKLISDEHIQRLKSEMEGIIRENERIERESQGQLEELERRLKELKNIREDQEKTFEEQLKLLKEQHEDELKRRRAEWREKYEREKEEMTKNLSEAGASSQMSNAEVPNRPSFQMNMGNLPRNGVVTCHYVDTERGIKIYQCIVMEHGQIRYIDKVKCNTFD